MQLRFDDQTQIFFLTMQMPGSVNKINAEFTAKFSDFIDTVGKNAAAKGIILQSAHRDFCVGADLELLESCDTQASSILAVIKQLNQTLRRMEKLPIPIVALLNGSALGGGLELALACHCRIATDNSHARLGLPEVTLGIIPGAGGTQRLPRLIGIEKSLEIMLTGKALRISDAKLTRLVDELSTESELISAALAWIKANPKPKQPWDLSNRVSIGPQVDSEMGRQLFLGACAQVIKKTAGLFLAPQLALSAIQEGLRIQIDRAIELEAEFFASIIQTQQAKDMLRILWKDKNAVEKCVGLPTCEDPKIRSVGIIGAGMMGSEIAQAFAKKGFSVVLNDVSDEALSKAKKDLMETVLLSNDLDTLSNCDLIIEAVFEDTQLKKTLTKRLAPKLPSGSIWASNTSAIPISDLATAHPHPENMIGLHFFSPVHAMQLVEVVMGEKTSKDTLARSLACVRAVRKLPIVVNDGYGFYTTRLFCAYVLEGAQLVAEGYDPVLIEWAAKKAGMLVSPLQVTDEVSLSLICHALKEGDKYGFSYPRAGAALLQKMLELGRPGKIAGKGFYNYDGDRHMWTGPRATLGIAPRDADLSFLTHRIQHAQQAELKRVLDGGIIRQQRDIDVGAVFGLGFAPYAVRYLQN